MSMSEETLPQSSGFLSKLEKFSPRGWVANLLTYILAVLTIWGVAYSVLGDVSLPGTKLLHFSIRGGTVFSLLVLVVMALLGGKIMTLIKLPPLLGMLLVGILLRNIPLISDSMGIDPSCAGALRSLALVVILLRAGLGLNPSALKKLSLTVFLLAVSPVVFETLVVAVLSHFTLGFPWTWGFMLGFILAAVSPAVVVPCLLSLQERGYGVAKGIPTLVMSAASLNDVFAISAFTILLSITFHPGNSLTSTILQGPLEAFIGVVWGVAWGALTTFLPSEPSTAWRVLLLVGGALLALFGSAKVGIPGTGALAVLVMGFSAGIGWRSQGWQIQNPVSKVLSWFWVICEPLLFGLIGAEIKITSLDLTTVGWGVLIIICGSLVRLLVTYPTLLKGGLTHKERLFVDLAWLPKATVQAALGPKALDLAREAFSQDNSQMANLTVQLGEEILTIAVLVILITAPIGAVAIMTSGPRLLQTSHMQNGQISNQENGYASNQENDHTSDQENGQTNNKEIEKI